MEGQATLCYYYKNGISSGTWSYDAVHKSLEFGFDNMLCDLNRTSKT